MAMNWAVLASQIQPILNRMYSEIVRTLWPLYTWECEGFVSLFLKHWRKKKPQVVGVGTYYLKWRSTKRWRFIPQQFIIQTHTAWVPVSPQLSVVWDCGRDCQPHIKCLCCLCSWYSGCLQAPIQQGTPSSRPTGWGREIHFGWMKMDRTDTLNVFSPEISKCSLLLQAGFWGWG